MRGASDPGPRGLQALQKGLREGGLPRSRARVEDADFVAGVPQPRWSRACAAEKNGTRRTETNHPPFKACHVLGKWADDLWAGGKLRHSWYERYSRQVRKGHAQRKRDLEAVRAGEANARIDQGVPSAISEGQHDPRYVLGCSVWLFQRAGTSTAGHPLPPWMLDVAIPEGWHEHGGLGPNSFEVGPYSFERLSER